MRSAAEILDERLEAMLDSGVDVDGWYLTRCNDGYAAWFFRVSDTGDEVPVVTGVVIDISDSAEEAAIAAAF